MAKQIKHDAFNNRVYYKPALRRPIIRSKGVTRTSVKVMERSEMFKKVAPEMVIACRGQPWPAFVACLKDQARAKGLGTGMSKTSEYRKRFWKHK